MSAPVPILPDDPLALTGLFRGDGVVFAWWGTHARGLRGVLQRLRRQSPAVPVRLEETAAARHSA